MARSLPPADFDEFWKEKLAELTVEYELERSALMALKQSIQAYRGTRPEV